jgi:hypothetical protein
MGDEDQLPSMFLTSKEVEEFTGYKRSVSQMEWLTLHGHSFAMNGQGRVIVLRAYVENLLGLNKVAGQKKEKVIEPNWAALNA